MSRLERFSWLPPLLASLVTAVASLGNRFTNDDDVLIANNPFVHDTSHLIENLTRDYFYSASTASIGYYRPFTKLAFILEYQLFGANPFGYHLISALWHVACVLMGYALLRRLSFTAPVAAIAATFLAVHPAQGESLGIIASRSDLTVTFGTFAALWGYVSYRTTNARRYLAIALLAETFALGSKESGVGILALVFLWEIFAPGFRWRSLGSRRAALWMFVPLVVYVAIRLALHIAPIATPDTHARSARILAAAQLVFGFAARTLVPTAWPPYVHARFPDPIVGLAAVAVVALVALVAASVLAMVRIQRARWAIALMWIPALPVLLPVFTAIHVSDDPRLLVLSDRWVYPSALGAGAIWGVLAEAAWTRSPKITVRALLVALGVVWFSANALAARGESSSFHDEPARLRWVADALREKGSLAPADEEYVWGADAMDAEARGEWPHATQLYRQLLERRPSDYSRRFNLARALLAAGQRDEGLFQAYLTFEGRTPEGRRLPVNDSFFRHRSERAVLLASAFEERGDDASARRYYASALRLDPSNRIARDRLAALR